MNKNEWRAVGQRLRVTRMALGITEQKAAKGFGVSLRTYRGYEAGGRQRSLGPTVKFSRKYDVSLSWLFDGEAALVGRHLAVSASKVAILPVTSPEWRSLARGARLPGRAPPI
jgi:transcriptional regulator with XRE-family HTH domain